MQLRQSIAFLVFCTLISLTTEVQGQLLEDTDRKLKTSRKEGRGFLWGLFSKQGRSAGPSSLSFGKTSTGRSIKPRYSRPVSYGGGGPNYRSISFRDPYRKQKKTPQPRYTKSGSPFSSKDRFVPSWKPSGSPWPNKRYKIDSRSISGMPFSNKRYTTKIRSASGMPFPNKRYKPMKLSASGMPFPNTRYKPMKLSASGMPFSNKRYTTQIRSVSGMPFPNKRYKPMKLSATEMPFRNTRYKTQVRSATGMPWSNMDLKVLPIVSPPSPYPKKYYNVRPRYSGTPTFNLAMQDFWKRFTRPSAVRNAGPIMWKKENSRYKNIAKYSGPFPNLRSAKGPTAPPKYPELGPVIWKVPKYRGPLEDVSRWKGPYTVSFARSRYKRTEKSLNDYMGPNKGIRISKNTYKKGDSDLGEYLGPHKMKIAKVKGDLHPSYRYKRTVLVRSEMARTGYRKWNIFWAGINRNQEQPKGVKEKISKPKFDKKEREIWNN